MTHRRRDACRSCGERSLEPVLDLGLQPLANSLPASPADFAEEPRFPLELAVCGGCGLVQLLDVIDAETLFGHYLYVSGTSDTMAEHHARYARDVARERELGPESLVVEVASNDGSLLLRFAEQGARVLGVEPARNVAELARGRGVETLCEFFGAEAGRRIAGERGPAACVVANNVLAHVEDPADLLAGMAALAAPAGAVVVEVPWVSEMVDRLEYDTIYHEHHCYFSAAALCGLYERAGLSIERIDRVPVHGGSLRVHARPRGVLAEHAAAVLTLREEERARGLASPQRYLRFARDVRESARRLKQLLASLKSRGSRLAAYGAPAKGSTLLNYCGIGPELLEFTVDKSPLKVGRYTPGTHLPILDAGALLERRPDHALILAWNFADEIARQQAAYRAAGGRFLVPLPAPRILP